MVKLPDLSKLTSKLDVSGLVKNVKSMVSPDQAAAAFTLAPGADSLSQKMAEINTVLKSLASAAVQQADAVSKLSKAVAALGYEIEAMKKTSQQAASSATTGSSN